ncbi:MAG: mono/diheme cytochrome c family protein [Pirellulaceae bacterium]|jgi:mono/diheme cytochrome c family protein
MRTIIWISVLLISFFGGVASGQRYADEVSADKPILYLRFEELDEAGNNVLRTKVVRDSAGDHHGAVEGGLSGGKGVAGIGGRAAMFDGRSSVITVEDDGSFKLDSLSIEFWVRTEQRFDDIFWPGSATFITKATPGAGTSDWTINAASTTAGDDQGRMMAESGPAGKKSDLYLWSPEKRKLNDGRWHHVVWTRSEDGENKLYLDGELASRGNDGGGKISNDRAIQLGADPIHGGSRHFEGQLDEVAVYDKVLIPQRIRAHYSTASYEQLLPPAATRQVDFVKDIQPLFRRRCFECHGADSEEGGLTLARRAEALAGGDGGLAIQPGSSVNSRLVHLVAGVDKDKRMPPEQEPLTNDEIGLIRAWIDQGAQWPETADITDPRVEKALRHWAYRPLTSPEIPALDESKWGANAIDAFILKKLAAAGIEPPAEADRATLLRRTSFDIIGLPPTPAEVEAFLAGGDDAYRQTVDRLLDSPHYGERWARHWLDVVRYADSAGYELDSFFDHAWRYRDYVIRSFNDDKPFDRFIHEQLAADELWPNDESLQYATGLLSVGPFRYEGGIARPDVVQYERLTDVTDTAATAFLGITVGCARCHAHKYDPILQSDYFGLQAVFAPSQLWDVNLKKAPDNSNDRRKQQLWVVQNRNAAPTLHILRRGELSSPGKIAKPSFIRALPGGGPLEEGPVEEGPVEEGPDKSFLQRRTKFARWLTSERNPLTARVIANRVWQWHFGRSLVPTPDDFGLQGEPPTHPELLDYLATELIENGWKLKHLHRLIMHSDTYKMVGPASAVAKSADPDNQLYSSFPRRRLEAESIWDNLHAVAGTLNREQFGPAVVPPIEKSALDSLVNTKWDVTKDEKQWTRRGVYIVVRRSLRAPFFDTFNAAEPSTSCVRRDTTVVSPQALALLNGATAGKQAREFAGRLLRESGTADQEIVERAWMLAYGRKVSGEELSRSVEFLRLRRAELAKRKPNELTKPLGSSNPDFNATFDPALGAALVEFCLALMNTNEFIYID